MTKNIKLEPILIWQGLLKCDRKSLAIFLALFEDGKGLSLLSDKLVDIKRKVGKAYDSFAREGSFNTGDNIEDSFAKRIEKTAHNIEESNLSNDVLKTALWVHLLEATSLLDDSLMSPRDVNRHCHNLANELTKNVATQYRKENQNIIGRFRFSKRKKEPDLSFEDAIEYLVAKITKEAAEKDSQVASEIKGEISNLDSSVIEKSGVSDLTEATINKTLLTGGSLLGLMSGVQAAGFSAYIMAAQASAIIPLIGGKTLVSLLFVVTNPFFVIPAIVATGAISKNKLEKSIKQSFSTTISAFLVMRGMASETNVLESENLLASFEQNTQLVTKSSILRIKPQKQNLVTKAKISTPNLAKAEQKLLNSKVHISHESNKQILRIQPSSNNMVDNGAIAGLTFADFIYDIAAIDLQVMEATDFARKADISNVFEFAAFSEGLSGLGEASLRGHHANLMGYTAERLVASRLAKDGYVVEIPNSASQPGYDLLVDGHEFQVKCIEPENYSILEKHFDKYPETPVFVNAEMAEIISARQPEWAEHVFYVGGYTHERASGLLTQALESGQNLDDYEVLSTVAIVSAVRNAIDWQKGEQSLQSATFNIAIDSLS